MNVANHPLQAPIRPDWLALHAEETLDPAQPIVDPHHHLYERPGIRYLLPEMLADLQGSHDLRASVFVQARAMYRTDGPEEMRPVGETEFANGIAAICASGIHGGIRLCAGIVSAADLTLGRAVRPVLEAQIAAAPARFRGIRHTLAWDADAGLLNPAYKVSEGLMESPAFRDGFAMLGETGLSFDAWLFFHQIPRLTALARAFPQVPIVLNHCGGILGVGPYRGRQQEVFSIWSSGLRELATCGNVMVKLGGLGMRMSGFGFDASARPASSEVLAEAWRPWMETCIEAFGTGRCMFESNFPVDKASFAWNTGWNAMKRIAAGASREERDDLFWRSAARFYRLRPADLGRLQP